MNRRDLFKTAVAGAGALGANAQHPQDHATAARANPAKPAAWKPLLFDAHQNATVTAVCDLIIPATDTPGAKDARVNEYIDLILAEGSQERRTQFIQGLGWLDGHALRQHQRPFVQCSKTQQTAVLTAFDQGTEPALEPGTRFFRLAKRLTIEGYYSSKAGIDDLNKGGRVPSTFGCKGSDH